MPAFSPFPSVISKAFLFGVVESQDCVVKSKSVLGFKIKNTQTVKSL